MKLVVDAKLIRGQVDEGKEVGRDPTLWSTSRAAVAESIGIFMTQEVTRTTNQCSYSLTLSLQKIARTIQCVRKSCVDSGKAEERKRPN